jgi:hypothetical protein
MTSCKDCPQYGQAIIYKRKCYYVGRQCLLPVFLQAWRLKRLLKKRARETELTKLLMFTGGYP